MEETGGAETGPQSERKGQVVFMEASKVLDQVRTHFFELSEYSDSLDRVEKDRLLKRWEYELAAYPEAFIGHSLGEWLARKWFAVMKTSGTFLLFQAYVGRRF